MHVFWQPGFTLLHARVCDFLAETHHVDLLPLLAVNQHLRKLVTDRLVEAYSKAVCKGWSEDGMTLKIVGGGFIRLSINSLNTFQRAGEARRPALRPCQAVPRERRIRRDASRRPDLVRPPSETRMCKFKSPKQSLNLQWNMNVERTTRMPQAEFFEGVFNMTPTGWFRPKQNGEKGIKGLVLAIDPTAYPPFGACFYPGIPAKIDGKIDVLNKPVYRGWKISYHASRSDRMLTALFGEMLAAYEALPAEDSDLPDFVPVVIPASCKVEALEIPLVDLFVPPGWSKKRPW